MPRQWPTLTALLFSAAVSAQFVPGELIEKIHAVRYPSIANMARVQGDVHLTVNDGHVTLVSGNRVLDRQLSRKRTPPPSNFQITGTHFEIWVFGTSKCIQT